MDSMLGKLFGGGNDSNDHAANAKDFISRFEQGPADQGYSEQEALQHYQNVAQHADPETIQRASEQTFSRMDPSQRTQMAQMLQQQAGGQTTGAVSNDPRQMAGMVSQIQQQHPGGLASLLGGGGSGGIGGALGGLLGGGGNSGNSGGGFPGGTLGKVALGGIAAYAMKEMLGGGLGKSNDNNRQRSV